MTRLPSLTNGSAGFTLIEILISVVVLAIGLLGMAALQMNGLRNNQSAYFRAQATQLAYDMADRMRTNIVEARDAASGGTYNNGASTANNCATGMHHRPNDWLRLFPVECRTDGAVTLRNRLGLY